MDNRSPGWLFWGAFAVAVLLATVQVPRSATPAYRTAAHAWRMGRPIYTTAGSSFAYLPHTAIGFVPVEMLPYQAGEIIWRLLIIGCFVAGFCRVLRLLPFYVGREPFLRMSALTAALAASCVFKGQTTLLMGGLMMHALAELPLQRWWRCALWLGLALAVKPMAVVLVLLVFCLVPAARARLAIVLAGLALLPFLTQHPGYVAEQYRLAFGQLNLVAESGEHRPWANVFGLLDLTGLSLSALQVAAVRILAGLAILALASRQRASAGLERFSVLLYSLSAVYLVLFTPGNENNTYALLGPALSITIATEWYVYRRPQRAFIGIALAAGIVGSYEIGTRLLPQFPAVWLAPLCALGYGAIVVADILFPPFRRARKSATRGDMPNSTVEPACPPSRAA